MYSPCPWWACLAREEPGSPQVVVRQRTMDNNQGVTGGQGTQSGDHTESGSLRTASPRGGIKAEAEVARRRECGECPGQR